MVDLLLEAQLRVARQRLLLSDGTVLKDDRKSLEHYTLTDGCTVILKDLGPQVSWKSVFLIEYAGPLLIHQAFFAAHYEHISLVQLTAYACITLHFLKREYETLFVHRFSHNTMPLSNLVKNSAHYWLIGGLWIGYDLYHNYQSNISLGALMGWGSLFMLAELGNLYSHVVLRRLRSHDPKARGIPHGFGFNWVSCPNYLFESIAWFAFAGMTRLTSSWVFFGAATIQMYLWARKKHAAYKKEFPKYPKSRTSMFPFLP